MYRDQLNSAGWRRHSVLSKENGSLCALQPVLLKELWELASKERAIAILTTYDCAIIHPDFQSEPWVQLVIGTPTEFDKNFSRGKHERRLHLEVVRNGQLAYYEVTAAGIGQVPREVLLTCNPDLGYALDRQSRNDLNEWITERFKRSTWPDAFNNAIRPRIKQLKKFYTRHNDLVSGVHLWLDEYGEKSESNRYKVLALILIEDEKARPLLRKLRSDHPDIDPNDHEALLATLPLSNELEAAFADTVEFEEIAVEFEHEFTVENAKRFDRFSPSYLSDIENEAPFPLDATPSR